jgi:hypothetical protein
MERSRRSMARTRHVPQVSRGPHADPRACLGNPSFGLKLPAKTVMPLWRHVSGKRLQDASGTLWLTRSYGAANHRVWRSRIFAAASAAQRGLRRLLGRSRRSDRIACAPAKPVSERSMCSTATEGHKTAVAILRPGRVSNPEQFGSDPALSLLFRRYVGKGSGATRPLPCRRLRCSKAQKLRIGALKEGRRGLSSARVQRRRATPCLKSTPRLRQVRACRSAGGRTTRFDGTTSNLGKADTSERQGQKSLS